MIVYDDAFQICIIKKRRDFFPLTDKLLLHDLIQPQDQDAAFLSVDNYCWWVALGEHYKPRRIAEIGTRFGYSVVSVLKGAQPLPDVCFVACYDAECNPGDKEPLAVFEDYYRNVMGYKRVRIERVNTQKIDKLGLTEPVDMVIVDADHSRSGCYHDCRLAWDALHPGGVLVVDDAAGTAETNPVRAAVEFFCREKGLEFGYLPSLVGIILVRKPI